MLEREHLQKLMLEARSSVRRSSQNNQQDAGAKQPDDEERTADLRSETIADEPVAAPQEASTEATPATKEPLTERELFPEQEVLNDRDPGKQVLTETDLFPDNDHVMAVSRQPEKISVVKVILPKEDTTESTTRPKERQARETRREAAVQEPPAFRQEAVEAPEERIVVYKTVEPTPTRTRSKTGLYPALLIAALLAGFGGYYFYSTNQNKDVAANRPSPPAPVPQSQTPAPVSVDTMVMRNEGENQHGQTTPVATEQENEPVETPVTQPSVEPPAAATNNTTPVTTTDAALGQYKVISKAYFHDEPDESTRRKAFIIHWNNAVLTPQDEKNGFVYIVFTNHLGQTSRGWLRKRDLRSID